MLSRSPKQHSSVPSVRRNSPLTTWTYSKPRRRNHINVGMLVYHSTLGSANQDPSSIAFLTAFRAPNHNHNHILSPPQIASFDTRLLTPLSRCTRTRPALVFQSIHWHPGMYRLVRFPFLPVLFCSVLPLLTPFCRVDDENLSQFCPDAPRFRAVVCEGFFYMF